jgi:hypothetical protein
MKKTNNVTAKKVNSSNNISKTVVSETKSFPFLVIGFIFILSSLFLSFFPDVNRGWGLNYIKFFAPWVIVLFYTLLLCFWLPPTNKLLQNVALKISRVSIISVLSKYKLLIFIIVSLLFGYIFHLLDVKYILLGDLDLRPKQIEEGHIINDEYLTMLFFKHAHLFLHDKFGYTGIQTVRLFDYITGFLFIFISLYISNALGSTFLKKLAVFFVATLSLTILLQFCGYTEIYAFPVLFLLLYLFTCILHLKGKVSVFLPVVIFIVSLGVHLLLVCMLPSLLFLIYRDKLWKYQLFRKRSTFIIIIILSFPIIYFGIKRFALPMMLPFSSENQNLMTMFSVAHCKEFFNSQLLASGIGFLIWIATIIYSLIYRIKYNALEWFFLISSISITGLMFVFDAHRGSGDWDIYSFAAVVYNLSNASFLLMLHDNKICKNIKYGILMISGFSILHTSMWIVTNKTDSSLDWFEKAFETDPGRYYKISFNNEAMIAAAFSANDLPDRAMKWNKKAYLKHKKDPRMGFNYANSLANSNRKEEAIVIYEKLTVDFPIYALPYAQLVDAYIKAENYQALYDLLVRMKKAYDYNPEAFISRLGKDRIDTYFNILDQLNQQIANKNQQ